jgi:hypothetical protein
LKGDGSTTRSCEPGWLTGASDSLGKLIMMPGGFQGAKQEQAISSDATALIM